MKDIEKIYIDVENFLQFIFYIEIFLVILLHQSRNREIQYKDMEIQKLKVKEKLKISAKTKIELLQAIANLMRQNIKGRYDEKILLYRQALEQYKKTPVISVISTPSSDEITAIMLFNKDKRFTRTE